MASVIKTNKLSKSYGRNKVLSDLDLEVSHGQVLGYLGPNGAGKTTTIKLLLGLIRPTSGSATIFDLDCQRDRIRLHDQLAYVPSEPSFWPSLTGKETLRLLSKLRSGYDSHYQDQLIKEFDFDVNKKIRQYSRGNRQKISLIAAFSTKAKLLIMDEPSTGLDPLMEQVFREHVKKAKANGQTVFLSSHLLEEVEALCDHIAILKNGRLIESGSLAELRHLSAVSVEAVFGSKPPAIEQLSGVSNVVIQGNKLTCQVAGSVNEVLSVLIKSKPLQLYSHPASLEDLFLSVYGS